MRRRTASIVLVLTIGCSRPNGVDRSGTVAQAPVESPRRPSSAAAGSARGATPAASVTPASDELAAEREALVRRTIEERGVKDPRVLAAMRRVPRHRFVLPRDRGRAYVDGPLPIVGGQTISQPYIVAFMTEAAHPRSDAKCLEIGTGSGYQAAVLAEVCGQVFSIEYLPAVARFGEQNLRRAGYGSARVHLRVGDGYAGWPAEAPFDVILVTAAPEKVPPPLLEQLAVGGTLVIPVGSESGIQELERWTRRRPGAGEGAFERQDLLGVRFVPFLGEGAGK